MSELIRQLDSLFAEYYQHGDSDSMRRKVVDHIRLNLERLKKDSEFLDSLQCALDISTNQLFTEVFGSLKGLKEEARRLCLFLYLKMSTQSICLLLDITPQTFYTRKNRLIAKLETSASPRKDELIAGLK